MPLENKINTAQQGACDEWSRHIYVTPEKNYVAFDTFDVNYSAPFFFYDIEKKDVQYRFTFGDLENLTEYRERTEDD